MRPLLAFLLLLLPRLAAAQASLSGVIQDSVTHQPLAFASVFLANTTLGVTTAEQGKFEFPRVPAGTYNVRVVCTETGDMLFEAADLVVWAVAS